MKSLVKISWKYNSNSSKTSVAIGCHWLPGVKTIEMNFVGSDNT